MDRVTVTALPAAFSSPFGLFFRRWLSNHYLNAWTGKVARLSEENTELAPLPKQLGKLNKQLQDQGILSQKWLGAKHEKETLERELNSLKDMAEKIRGKVEEDKE